MKVVLEPMSEERYATWLPVQIDEYAKDKIKADIWDESEAAERSATDMTSLLSDGLATPGHDIFVALVDGEEVGNVWLWTHAAPAGQESYIYNIEIDPGHQGKGYGRGLLETCEAWCAESGVVAIRLNVFSYNATAIKLYETSGFTPTNVNMIKRLPAS